MPALAHRTTMPRPDDLDILRRIAEATLQGHSLTTAAELAGIGRVTAQEWRTQGQAQLDAGEELGSHAAFASALNEAEAEMVDAKLGVINEATLGKGGWVPAMTLLERRRPQDFGRFQRVEIEQRATTLNITAQFPPEAAQALLAMAQEERAEGLKFLPSPQDKLS